MIHDATNQTASSVPEELYNLTQLADVTLAAGKLSTTNIQTIKDYIRGDESITPAASNPNPNRPLQITELIVVKRSNSSNTDTSDSSSETNSPQKLLSDAGYMSDIEYLDKKTFLYALHSNHSQSMDTDTSVADSCGASIKSFGEQRQSSFSSSEDDSTYNYSHKIFDKRKSRKLLYQSQNSENLSKLSSTFNSNDITAETEDSMLSISEAESNDDEARQKIKANLIVNNMVPGEQTTGDVASETESMNSNCGSDDVHTCPECGKKYSTSSNLARHRQTHRSLLDKKARRCPHCDKGKRYKYYPVGFPNIWLSSFNRFPSLLFVFFFAVYVSIPAYSMHLKVSIILLNY